ncbi:MAG: phosphatase PAP2 family protein [Moraxella sp.]|nr:phosphatase PAP2 family protein [Moraxella sp.]
MNDISYLLEKLQYWLKWIILSTLLVLFVNFNFFPIQDSVPMSEYTFWDWMNKIGVRLGIAGLILALAFPKYFNQKIAISCFGFGFLIYLVLLWLDSDELYRLASGDFSSLLAPLGVFVLSAVLVQFFKHKNKALLQLYIYLSLFVIFLGISTNAALEIVHFARPATYDVIAYKIDEAYFGTRHWLVMLFDGGAEWFKALILTVYGMLSLCLFMFFGLVIRDGGAKKYNIVRTIVVPFGVAFVCYMIVPISGPIYAFSEIQLLGAMPPASEFLAKTEIIPPAPRNGMPSMHFTGAFMIWLLAATLRKKLYFYLTTFFLALTVIATLGTGEHYVVDLIVAMPFAIALSLVLISPQGWFAKKSTRILWSLAAATFVFWMISIVAMPGWLSDNLWFVRLLSLWSIGVWVYLTAFYLKLVWKAPVTEQQYDATLADAQSAQQTKKLAHYPKWVVGAFVTSGFAGLLYEVVYAKSLAITFGSTSLASYTVLVTYMGGMALGAWIGGIFADKVKKPLMYYIGIEAIIGLYAVLTPTFFKLIQWVYLSMVGDLSPDAPILTAVRVGLGALVLGIPTILMGATVPFMFKYLKTFGVTTESAVSKLYSANVVGAAAGSLIGAYVILPTLGRIGATNLAAAISLLLALYVLDQVKKLGEQSIVEDNTEAVSATKTTVSKAIGISALLILTIGGAITLGLEVVSIHMLAVVAGNSVYAFGLMLATFLAGLSMGSIAGEKILKYISNRYTIVLAQCGVCISIIVTAFFWDKVPDYFASFGVMAQFHTFDFTAREIIRGAVCAIAMFPAAFFIGINYPASMSLASDWLSNKGEAKAVGIASALNTFGNISGVLIIAFYALPTFGSNRVFFGLALLAFALAVLMFVVDNKSINVKNVGFQAGIASLVASFALFFAYPKQWDFNRLSQGANVYFAPSYWGEVIDYTESITGGITSVAKDPNSENLTLLTNGKFQGNNTGEIEAQESIALIPLLHTDKRDSTLVIGYGTGMSARVLHDQHFKVLDVVELAKDIVTIADKYFPENNMGVSSKPNVNMYYTDGRNYLLTQDKKYDLISMEISSIWFAGAANLYNKEFYQLAKKRLHDDGILQQWVQLHHIYPQDLVYILNTVRSEFEYVWLYESGGQGIIVASNSPEATNYHVLKPPYHDMTAEALKERSDDLARRQILTPKGINNLAKTFDPTLRRIISTDNNLKLEYSTPKGNAIVADDTVIRNIEFLHQFELQE